MQNIILSNKAYLKKDLEAQSTLSLMTRVISQLENYESYVVGKTPVAFIGVSELTNNQPGFDEVVKITGLKHTSPISHGEEMYFEAYFKYVLNYPINLCDDETIEKLKGNAAVKSMPAFPDGGSIEEINGIVVVKLGTHNNIPNSGQW